MLTPKCDTDLCMQPCKRQHLGPEEHPDLSEKDCQGSQNDSVTLALPVKRTRNDGSITVCDKQPRVLEVLQNPNGESVHDIYFEINHFLGELHFQKQVRELRNRFAAQKSPSKSSS
jgi:hypothetical protein